MWEACPVNDPLSPYALHIVLIDAEGDKIEAIARKGLMSKFKSKLCEGKVYTITYFSVLSNSGGFMASEHDYKIMFNEKTRAAETAIEESIGVVYKSVDSTIPKKFPIGIFCDIVCVLKFLTLQIGNCKCGTKSCTPCVIAAATIVSFCCSLRFKIVVVLGSNYAEFVSAL
ncbi:uncharacterized protein LOC130713334 [Lotus japonicus]|uniref:uncharacterized protein LOC130713334 n=1 Tax=Lotus japonicus TaxID=34305 RepID=UPI002582C219|nr:uncharacterized protein LOC130713334 [Lotus japonicus]